MMGMMDGMPGRFGGGRSGMPGRTSPEGEALQEALDSNAPTAQTRTLLAKFREARNDKQAALAKTQDDLRAVLTPRQEAIAMLKGLLD
jgi:Spy/CpxP family protein refolding chaperone